MKTPIIVHENGDIEIIETLEAAKRYLEPSVAYDKLITGYDAAGHRLIFGIRKERVKYFFGLFSAEMERLTIDVDEDEPGRVQELTNVLHRYLMKVDSDYSQQANGGLDELIQRAMPYARVR